jgi:hypothetical protein
MNRQLGDLNFLRAYMDDICVFSSSFNEHIDNLLIVFDRLFLSGIKLNWAKCFFFQHRIAILGHIIEHNKIMMNPLKIDKIRDMTPPKSIIQYPIFRPPDFHKKFFLFTDASNHALRFVLSQMDNDAEYVVMYGARSLNLHSTEVFHF